MSKCCWKNDTDRFAQYRIATYLQLKKQTNTISAKHNKVNHNKEYYAYIYRHTSLYIYIYIYIYIYTHGDQKEIAWLFQSVERKYHQTQNPIPSENILQEWRKNPDIFKGRKVKRIYIHIHIYIMRYACLYIYIFILLQCTGAAISPVQVTSFYIPLAFPVYKIVVLNIFFIYI